MNCLTCGGKTKVIDSRLVDATCRRRRVCLVCGFRFSTQEQAEVLEAAEAPVTRADCIRAMADEELARHISDRAIDCLCDIVCDNKACEAKNSAECRGVVLAWLQGEAVGAG